MNLLTVARSACPFAEFSGVDSGNPPPLDSHALKQTEINRALGILFLHLPPNRKTYTILHMDMWKHFQIPFKAYSECIFKTIFKLQQTTATQK
jgi:hypothetical protein